MDEMLGANGVCYRGVPLYCAEAFTVTSYRCEEVLILHNKPHPPPPILPNNTEVSRCKFCISRQHLEVVTKPHSVYQLCGGGDTRNLHTRKRGRGGGGGSVRWREGSAIYYYNRQMENLQVIAN